jgi:hypothetical protein
MGKRPIIGLMLMVLFTYLISFVIALVIMQNVYEKLAVNPKSYFLYQVGLFGQNGIFWSVILNIIDQALK